MKRALYQVLHDTHYRYSAPVSLAQQLAQLLHGHVFLRAGQ